MIMLAPFALTLLLAVIPAGVIWRAAGRIVARQRTLITQSQADTTHAQELFYATLQTRNLSIMWILAALTAAAASIGSVVRPEFVPFILTTGAWCMTVAFNLGDKDFHP